MYKNRDEAYDDGWRMAKDREIHLHDLFTQLKDLKIPLEYQGAFMNGVEDAYEDEGFIFDSE